MTLPYTYRVTHLPSGTWYYGVRYAEGCHPSDLFKIYFTSSGRISKLICEYGIGVFKTEIRRTFKTKEAAINWEHRVLRKILRWPDCLNESAFPAVSPEANRRATITLKEKGVDGLNHYERNGRKWKEKKNNIDSQTGLTFAEIRRLRFNESLNKNGTRYIKGDITGEKNPAKKEDVRKKISNTLKERIASGQIIPWPTGKKLQYVSDRMKGSNIVAGMKWYNDGKKDYRLRPAEASGLIEGRLFSAVRGKKYAIVCCPHCGKEGSGGNMTRFHFDNCKRATD